ncbi:MAG: UbiD family decarboxylase [Candidatus Nezhaarchaeota archaeon]|nr:UbiD family decarboxylase [Candidatus Nezhaarchaeota archaeon]
MLSNEVKIIEQEVSPIFEAALILKKNDGGPIVLFKRLKGHDMPAVGNVVGSRARLLKCLGARTMSDAYNILAEGLERPLRPKEAGGQFGNFYAAFKGGLSGLPAFKYYERDAGRYITSSIVIAKLDESCNASVHRLLVLDDNRAAIRIVPRHLNAMHAEAKKKGLDLPVAVVIGCHPSITLAAASSPPFGVNELWVANRIMGDGVKVVATPKHGIDVPVSSEIVLEGVIKADEYVAEGPFTDITGTYDAVRMQPVLRVDGIYINEEAVYQAVLPAGLEHKLLMGFPKEAELWMGLRKVIPRVRKVRLSEGGCGWLHAVISLEKATEGDAKTAIMMAFGCHPSLKSVVVVDEDINVDDPKDVEWAIATRFQADRGLVVVNRARGSSLDPSVDPETLLTCKVGVDATRPLGASKERFEKAVIPGEDYYEAWQG